MDADLHNLIPTVGEINSDRSNFNFGELSSTPKRHGSCEFRVDFKKRTVEPPDAIKGMLARIYFYMHDRYDMNMSKSQQKLLMAWDESYPISEWELQRNIRIEKVMGHANPFVSENKTWKLNHKNNGEGAKTFIELQTIQPTGEIRGNRNSKVYHLPSGCPSYGLISPKNIVDFNSEAAANNAGYRKAGNCR